MTGMLRRLVLALSSSSLVFPSVLSDSGVVVPALASIQDGGLYLLRDSRDGAYVSFANTAHPSGQGAQSVWMRAVYGESEAMPLKFKRAGNGTYKLANWWDCGEYCTRGDYVSFTANGHWLRAMYSEGDAMPVRFVVNPNCTGCFFLLNAWGSEKGEPFPDEGGDYLVATPPDKWLAATGGPSQTDEALSVQLVPAVNVSTTTPTTSSPTSSPVTAPPTLPHEWNIEHVVLLMMENRPFDFFYGFAQKELGDIDGLTGKECPGGTGGPCVKEGGARYVCKHTGSLTYDVVAKEAFENWDGVGPPFPTEQPNQGWGGYDEEVVAQFSPDQVPIHTALAQEFAVMDKYHTSFPGPSTPNHLFTMTASAGGCVTTGQSNCHSPDGLYGMRTIFESLQDEGRSWRYYYNDSYWVYFHKFFTTDEGKAGLQLYDEFYHRAATGTLPNFSWVLPRQATNSTTGEGPNDDHPCHDIALGEKLIKDTYEAVRAGPGWNKTLMIVIYDDTGGWFDHGEIPLDVPEPDNFTACGAPVRYNWLGFRSPTLLISPWISKGKVVHEPSGPQPNSQYEHSSIAATLKNIFGLPSFLTRRDAWAGNLADELDLKQPRTDCPTHLPDPPAPTLDAVATHGGYDEDDLTRRQLRRVKGFARANSVKMPDLARLTPSEAERFMTEQAELFRSTRREL